jgi:hypothetical protein
LRPLRRWCRWLCCARRSVRRCRCAPFDAGRSALSPHTAFGRWTNAGAAVKSVCQSVSGNRVRVPVPWRLQRAQRSARVGAVGGVNVWRAGEDGLAVFADKSAPVRFKESPEDGRLALRSGMRSVSPSCLRSPRWNTVACLPP